MSVVPGGIGIRRRTSLLFALGALLIGTLFGLGTYLTVSQLALGQRLDLAEGQAVVEARNTAYLLADDGERSPFQPVDGVVQFAHGDFGAVSSIPGFTLEDLPTAVRAAVEAGESTAVWTSLHGERAVAAGAPMLSGGAYYELKVTTELNSYLSTLRLTLAAWALFVTVGAVAFGVGAAGRLLDPLRQIGEAASKVASGKISTRLPASSDPDLQPIITSFNEMVDALEHRIQREARFAADVGHELRSPLTTLVAGVELLGRRRSTLDGAAQQALDLVTREVRRLRGTLEELIALSRFDAGIPQVLVVADLNAIVRQVLNQSGRPKWLLAADDTRLFVKCDRRSLARAVLNLFVNADLHGGGLTAVTTRQDGDWVELLVDDEGPGVPPADRQQIFARFKRGGARRNLPGSGLGLSLVEETVSALGGTIDYVARPRGARFRLRLPQAEG